MEVVVGNGYLGTKKIRISNGDEQNLYGARPNTVFLCCQKCWTEFRNEENVNREQG